MLLFIHLSGFGFRAFRSILDELKLWRLMNGIHNAALSSIQAFAMAGFYVGFGIKIVNNSHRVARIYIQFN